MQHNLTVLCARSVATKKFQPVDLSGVIEQRRDVLALTFPELLDFYGTARPGKRPDLCASRMRKWRAQFRLVSAWSFTPSHIAAMLGSSALFPHFSRSAHAGMPHDGCQAAI